MEVEEEKKNDGSTYKTCVRCRKTSSRRKEIIQNTMDPPDAIETVELPPIDVPEPENDFDQQAEFSASLMLLQDRMRSCYDPELFEQIAGALILGAGFKNNNVGFVRYVHKLGMDALSEKIACILSEP